MAWISCVKGDLVDYHKFKSVNWLIDFCISRVNVLSNQTKNMITWKFPNPDKLLILFTMSITCGMISFFYPL
jgi:hypothetical protein